MGFVDAVSSLMCSMELIRSRPVLVMDPSMRVLLTMSADTAFRRSSPRWGLSSDIFRIISIGRRGRNDLGRGMLTSWYSVVSPSCTFAWTSLMMASNCSYVVLSMDSWLIHVSECCGVVVCSCCGVVWCVSLCPSFGCIVGLFVALGGCVTIACFGSIL